MSYSMADMNAAFREAEDYAMSEFKAKRDAYVAGELTPLQMQRAERQYGRNALECGCQIVGRV